MENRDRELDRQKNHVLRYDNDTEYIDSILQDTRVKWCCKEDEHVHCRKSKMFEIECWSFKRFIGKDNEYDMLPYQQITI
ncbi:hypothetical protein CR513_46823, partial [Mucuna pruriens]